MKPSEFGERLAFLYDVRFLILVFLLLTSTIAYSASLEWDEGSFLQNAEYFSGEGSNFEESRPASLSYLISALWLFTGESAFAARILVSLFGAGCILVFHRIASKEFEDSLPVTAVFAFSPLLVYWSAHAYTDVPALLLILGSFYFYQRDRHFLSGALISLAATVRYIFLVFAFGMGFAYLVDHREKLFDLVAGGFSGSVPLLAYSKIYYGGFFSRITMYLTRVSKWSDSGLMSSVAPGIFSGVYTLSAMIPGMYPGWRKSSAVEKSMVAVYSLFIVFISGNAYDRYWLAILPFVLLIAYRGLDTKIFYLVSAIMIVVSGIGVASDGLTHQRCSPPLDDALDYSAQLEGEFVSDNWAIAGYRLDQPVSSPWNDLESLREGEGIDYAVMSSEEPYGVVKSFSNNCRTYYIYNLSDPSM
ncbi:MAG: hypothetical protein ACI8Z7_000132 [Candidatus Nanohaloarchaea archaeon]|jgi:hypothetical protein